ncbi:XRE family transcriptional regulator [Demequina sp. B12]|uniref:helix-turn-helix domain-containing protein n=1 Tax=Demequina sp. B12 TaxID=2992757 RepID=UPI00237A2593|nr:XRE family transcriptional regulator [Demequina sp. B12]MDE0572754.1 XRE family transcriptional regulator [Demequina sp. B12]
MADQFPVTESVMNAVPERLRRLRQRHSLTLKDVSASTGVSVSTLSRLESGARKPSLELLVTLAQSYRVPLDELVGMPHVGDPRVRLRPRRRNGRIEVPLHHRESDINVLKIVMPPHAGEADRRTHPGSSWIYVVNGRVRLRVGDNEWTLQAGEAAEFDTTIPHWFGADGDRSAEILSIYGPGHRCFGDHARHDTPAQALEA